MLKQFNVVETYVVKFLYKLTERDIVSCEGTGTYNFDEKQDKSTVTVDLYKRLKANKKIPILVKVLSITKS